MNKYTGIILSSGGPLYFYFYEYNLRAADILIQSLRDEILLSDTTVTSHFVYENKE